MKTIAKQYTEASCFTGTNCAVRLEHGEQDGNSTETTLEFSVDCQELAVTISDDGLRARLTITGEWERDGLLTSLYEVLCRDRCTTRWFVK